MYLILPRQHRQGVWLMKRTILSLMASGIKNLGFLLFICAWAPPLLFAQSPLNQPPVLASENPAPPVDLRVDKNLVLVPVSVLDKEDRPVAGLDRSDFRVFDDKAERSIESFSMEDGPVAVGLVFDTSGSMRENLRNARVAARAFFSAANPGDQFFLVEVSDTSGLTVPLTHDPRQIEARLVSAESRGQTPLLDAIYLGLNEIKKSKMSRKALLVISDGLDNHSRHTQREVQQLVRESDALVYAIRVYDPLDAPDKTAEIMTGQNLLQEIAEQTGGREYTAGLPQ